MTVIVVAWNGDEWLPSCVESLKWASANQIHLVLVDNKNNPCIPSLELDAFEVTALKTPHPMGFAEANNYALQHSDWQSGYVLFLNQDTKSAPGWIDRCLACFAEHPDFGGLSPVIRNYDDTAFDPNLLECAREWDRRIEPGVVGIERITGAAMMVKSEALRAVGPFDPVFVSYYEDYDLCARLMNAGFKLGLCTDAVMYHFSGSITTDRAAEHRRMRWLIRNRLIFRTRHEAGSRLGHLAQYFFKTLPVNLLRGLKKTPSSQPVGVTLRAVCDMWPIIGRLCFRGVDERAWQRYLARINWPQN